MSPDLLWTLFLAGAATAALAGYRDPRFALAALLFAAVNIPNRPPLYPVVVVGLVALPALWHYGRSHPGSGRIAQALVLIVWLGTVLDLLALARGGDLGGAATAADALSEAALVSFAFVAVWNQHSFVAALHVIRIVGIGSVALGWWQLSEGRFLLGVDYIFLGRFTFTGIADSNYAALYVLLFIAACFGIRYEISRPARATLSLLFFWIALAATLSRTGVIAAVVAGAVGVTAGRHARAHRSWISRRDTVDMTRSRVFTAMGVSAFVLVIVFSWTSSADVRSRIAADAYQNNAARLSGRVDTLAMRETMWAAAFDQLQPVDILLGQGDLDVIAWNRETTGRATTLHSLPLTILVRYGVLGLSALLLGVMYLLHRAVQLSRNVNDCARGIFVLTLLISYGVSVLTISDEIGIHLLLAATLTAAGTRSAYGQLERLACISGSPSPSAEAAHP